MKFHEKINSISKAKKVSQLAIAKRLGVSQSGVSLFLRGDSDPDIFQAKIIAEMLGVTLDFLLDESRDEPPGPPSHGEIGVMEFVARKGWDRLLDVIHNSPLIGEDDRPPMPEDQ